MKVIFPFLGFWYFTLLVIVLESARNIARYRVSQRFGKASLVFNTKRAWPLWHVKVVDNTTGKCLEMNWQNRVDNLRGSFRGQETWYTPDAREWRLPINVNYRRLRDYLLSINGKYRPWHNCQSAIIASEPLNPSFVILLFMQAVAVPLTGVGFGLWAWARKNNLVTGNLPLDSFFRMGPDQTNADTSEDEDETSPDDPSSTEFDTDSDRLQADTDSLVFEEAASLAVLASEGPEALSEDEAIHCAIMAVHKKLVGHQTKQEANQLPIKDSELLLALNRLGDDLIALVGETPVVKEVVAWLRGLAHQISQVTRRVILVLGSLLDYVYIVARAAFDAVALCVYTFIDYILPTNLAKRLKAVWGLGGLAKTPALNATRRILESMAEMANQPRGVFEDDFSSLVETLRSHRQDGALPTKWQVITPLQSDVERVVSCYGHNFTSNPLDQTKVLITTRPEPSRNTAGRVFFDPSNKDAKQFIPLDHDSRMKAIVSPRAKACKELCERINLTGHRVVFATGNQMKADEMSALLGVPVEIFDPKVKELHHTDVCTVAKDKLIKAERKLISTGHSPKAVLLVDDSGLSIEGKGPAGLIKNVLTSKGNKRFAQENHGKSATAQCALAFTLLGSGNRQVILGETLGRIEDNNCHLPDGNWDAMFGVEYGHRRPYTEAAAAMAADLTAFPVRTSAEFDALIHRLIPDDAYKIGGPQQREVTLARKPIMSRQEAQVLYGDRWSKHVREEKVLTERNEQYKAKIGTDQVILGHLDPERLMESGSRYGAFLNPKLELEAVPAPLSDDDIARAERAASAIIKAYPEQFKDAKMTHPNSILSYIKTKYSPGSPFIGHYKTREEMLNAGWERAIISKTIADMKSGVYRPQFYHGFGKSQVVSLDDLMRGKSIRTVVAEDLASYFIDQVVQLERNHRDTWRTTNVGTGMPLNQNMALLFNKLANYKNYIIADASAYDSRLKKITFETLSRLAEKGMHPKMASVLRAKYKAMGNAHIIMITKDGYKRSLFKDLRHRNRSEVRYAPFANTMDKNCGGGTGQSGTTFDNTWGMKAAMAMAYEEYHQGKRTMDDFFDESKNLFGNTSDDTIWGTNDDIDLQRFSEIALKYGLVLTMEQTSDISKAEYLGKNWVPVTAEAIKAIDEVNKQYKLDIAYPEGLVIQDPQRVFTRRTAIRYYQQSPYQAKYLKGLLDRTIGHATLCAFVPDLYVRLQAEYIEDAVRLIHNTKDANGCYIKPQTTQQYDTAMAWFSLKKETIGYRIHVNFNPNKGGIPMEIAERLRWLQTHPFPAYNEVIKNHMKILPEKESQKRHDKFLAILQKNIGPEQRINSLLDFARDIVSGIPDRVFRMHPALDMIYPDPIFQTPNQRHEAMVYLAHRPETMTEFEHQIAQGPYGTCCDGLKFWQRITEDDSYKAQIEATPLYAYKNLQTIGSLLYGFLYLVEFWVSGIPFLGTIYQLIMFALVDMNKVYAVMNSVYWHIHLRSSLPISAMRPRDPYVHSKRLAMTIADCLPLWVGMVLRFDLVLDNISTLVETAATTLNAAQAVKPTGLPNKTANEWSEYAYEYYHSAVMNGRIAIKAETGTGKSTYFVEALRHVVKRERSGRVWVVVPRRVLRDDWSLPFGTKFQSLQKGVTIQGNYDPVICTYGHFLIRLEAKEFNKDKDIAVFDEFHEMSGEMILANHLLRKQPVILLSATPVPVPGLENLVIKRPPVTKLNRVKIYEMEGNAVTMFQQAMMRHPEAVDRTLIMVPTYSDIDKTIAGLRVTIKPEQPVMELSNRTRVTERADHEAALRNGKYIFVCSQIVDAGFDVKPPARLVIDSGLQIQNEKGRITEPRWSSPENAEQRAGRTGRNSDTVDGIVFRHANAGTGKQTIAYPAGSLFMNTVVADFFKVPQLMPVDKPIARRFPVYNFTTGKEYTVPPAMKYSLNFVFLAAMSGVREDQMQKFYKTYAIEGKALPEEYDWLQLVLNTIPRTILKRFELWEAVDTHLARKPFMVNVRRPHGIVTEQWGLKYPIDNDWRVPTRSVKETVKLGHLSDMGATYKELFSKLKKNHGDVKAMAKTLKDNRNLLHEVSESAVTAKTRKRRALDRGLHREIIETIRFDGERQQTVRSNACTYCGGQSQHVHENKGGFTRVDFIPVTVRR